MRGSGRQLVDLDCLRNLERAGFGEEVDVDVDALEDGSSPEVERVGEELRDDDRPRGTSCLGRGAEDEDFAVVLREVDCEKWDDLGLC